MMRTRIGFKLRQPCYHVFIHFPGFTNYFFEIVMLVFIVKLSLFVNRVGSHANLYLN
jgi:hypothetical protein